MTEATERLLRVMSRLRDREAGCAWDVAQTFATIVPHTIEEAFEVADAIERGDMSDLKHELGDLLFQVVFHARVAEEAGLFDYEAVAQAIAEKMVRRHPHVFGDVTVPDAAAQAVAWESQKAAERGRQAAREGRPDSALDGVTAALPALSRALKLQKRAARVGFDWPDAWRVLDKLEEEARELERELAHGADPERVLDEVGDLLFTCANLARKAGLDPETALRHANLKFERRFRSMEAMLAADGLCPQETPLEEMERRWQEAKG